MHSSATRTDIGKSSSKQYFAEDFVPPEHAGPVQRSQRFPALVPVELLEESGDCLELIGLYAHVQHLKCVTARDLAALFRMDIAFISNGLEFLHSRAWIWDENDVAAEVALINATHEAHERAIRHIPSLIEPVLSSSAGTHVLYRLIGADDEPLYIGISSNIKKRLKDHRYHSWWPDVAKVTGEVFPSRLEALQAELHLIQHLKPLHNASTTSHLRDPMLPKEHRGIKAWEAK